MKIKSKQNNASNAALLASVRILTLLMGILSSSILSHAISLEGYGTYSAANLIVSVVSCFTIMGMMDGANYFYNQKKYKKEDCIDAIFFMQVVIGIVSMLVILLGRNFITESFNNPELNPIYKYIALRPMLTNLAAILLALQMVIGNSRMVAVRNIVFAIAKLLAVMLTAFVTSNIEVLLFIFLILDLATILFYYQAFRKTAFPVSLFKFDKSVLKPILKFCVPMGIYIMTNTFSKSIDKLFIGWTESTANLAIYTNCAAPLPLDIISAAFLTIMVPIVTRCIQNGNFEKAKKLFCAYLQIGYVSTVIFATAVILFSKDVISILYGQKYLAGQTVFIVYIFVDMLKFANTSLILTAQGKSKTLMWISFGSLGANFILNFVFHRLYGFAGPAFATLLITVVTASILLIISAKDLNAKMSELIVPKTALIFVLKLAAVGTVVVVLKRVMESFEIHSFIIFVALAGLYCLSLLLLNLRLIKRSFKIINEEKIENNR